MSYGKCEGRKRKEGKGEKSEAGKGEPSNYGKRDRVEASYHKETYGRADLSKCSIKRKKGPRVSRSGAEV